MKIACPKCSESDIRNGECPKCHFTLTIADILRLYRDNVVGFVRRKAVISCPHCGNIVKITASLCPSCKNMVTATAVKDTVTAPTRKWWNDFLNRATPTTMRSVQWVYLLASGVVLWCLLAYTEEHNQEHWVRNTALSVLYLTVMGFIAVLIIPPSVRLAITKRAAWRVKLAMIANYLTLMLILQMSIGAWWARALMMAGLFVATFLAIILFNAFFSPMLPGKNQPNTFDPSQPQGRRGRFD